MKKIESVIKVLRNESAPANKDWAIATGQEQVRNTNRFQHEETGVEYSWLSGGIAWPILAAQEKGCAVVIGCSGDDAPVFTVVDAAFEQLPRALIRRCPALRDKWCGDSSALFSSFTGPVEQYQQMLVDINNELENGNPKQRRIIINPPDLDEQKVDQTYLNTVLDLYVDNRLKVDVLPVKDALKRMTDEDADKKLSDRPVVAAVAYVLHDMITIKPWRSDGAGPFFVV